MNEKLKEQIKFAMYKYDINKIIASTSFDKYAGA